MEKEKLESVLKETSGGGTKQSGNLDEVVPVVFYGCYALKTMYIFIVNVSLTEINMYCTYRVHMHQQTSLVKLSWSILCD